MTCTSVAQKIANTTNWVKQKLQEIAKIETAEFRKILYYTLLDAFVQSYNDYSRNGAQKAFSDFLLTFSSAYRSILERICPVTLFHHYNTEYSFDELQLPEGLLMCADSDRLQKESERLLAQISDPDKRLKAKEKHQYSQLMYAERSKLVHELSPIGMPIDFGEQLPHVAQGYNIDDPSSLAWNLIIPESFVRLVLEDSIKGYLKHCQDKNLAPFGNNESTRKCRTAWYD